MGKGRENIWTKKKIESDLRRENEVSILCSDTIEV